MRCRRPLTLERLRALYGHVRGLVNPIQTREVLTAAAGLKTSRLGAPPALAGPLEDLLSSFGLYVSRSEHRFLARPDIGKGGWSNAFAEKVSASDPRGDWLFYVAVSEDAAIAAKAAEANGRDASFGSALGIPPCCTDFFLSRQDLARKKQYDFVPLVLDNTSESYPFNYWNNFVAQYFCYSLISFFPCSFTCKRAAKVAQATYEFLRQVNAPFAEAFRRMQRQSILYTEYRGLFLFERARYSRGFLSYSPAGVHMTVRNSALGTHLLAGTGLHVHSKHEVDVMSATTCIKKLKGANVSLCIF